MIQAPNLETVALVPPGVGSHHRWARAVEQRLESCDACARTFVLTYGRNGIGHRLASSVLTVAWVRCPWGRCQNVQGVLVPFESRDDVRVEVWLGQAPTGRRRSRVWYQ